METIKIKLADIFFDIFKLFKRRLKKSKNFKQDIKELVKFTRNKYKSNIQNNKEFYRGYADFNILLACLHEVLKKQTIIIIESYDAPLQQAILHGSTTKKSYKDISCFLRNFFIEVIKENRTIKKSILTGTLPLDSCIKGNGLSGFPCKVIDLIGTHDYKKYFGFNEHESIMFFKSKKNGKTYFDSQSNKTNGDFYTICPGRAKDFFDQEREQKAKDWFDIYGNGKIISKILQKASSEAKKSVMQLINGREVSFRLQDEIEYQCILENESLSVRQVLTLMFYFGYLSINQKNETDVGIRFACTLIKYTGIKNCLQRVLNPLDERDDPLSYVNPCI
ncbi:MAG: AAA family ATPase, partial [Gammaproteobacteria bacterium]|nr:AAA family ATPase [Gammaproteobacteria bacterium]